MRGLTKEQISVLRGDYFRSVNDALCIKAPEGQRVFQLFSELEIEGLLNRSNTALGIKFDITTRGELALRIEDFLALSENSAKI